MKLDRFDRSDQADATASITSGPGAVHRVVLRLSPERREEGALNAAVDLFLNCRYEFRKFANLTDKCRQVEIGVLAVHEAIADGDHVRAVAGEL